MTRWMVTFKRLDETYVEETIKADYFEVENGVLTFYHRIDFEPDRPVLVYFTPITLEYLGDADV